MHNEQSCAVVASVIILNFNAAEMTCVAIDAVLSQTVAANLQIIVVDNASVECSPAIFRERYGTRILLIENKENLGFAGGNNAAFPFCTGEYIFLLNNDAIPEPEWAEELIRAALEHPEAGMCTSRIYIGPERECFDNTGHLIYRDGLSKSRGHHERDAGQFNKEEEVLLASGCAALYRRDALSICHGFDETFFAYGDDIELGLRIRLLGRTCVYVPTAVVRHMQSRTLGAYSLKKIYLIERNRIWVLVKLLPLAWILTSPWFTLCRLFSAYRAAKNNKGLAGKIMESHSSGMLAWTILRAWVAALMRLPSVLRKRRTIMANTAMSKREWRRLLIRFEASVRDMSFER